MRRSFGPIAAFDTGAGIGRQVLLQNVPGVARRLVVERSDEAPPEALMEAPRLKTRRIAVRLRAATPSRLVVRGLEQIRGTCYSTRTVSPSKAGEMPVGSSASRSA